VSAGECGPSGGHGASPSQFGCVVSPAATSAACSGNPQTSQPPEGVLFAIFVLCPGWSPSSSENNEIT
jgi:hypothetical protein